jgi:hypothetical protein
MAQYAYIKGLDDPQPPTHADQRGRCVQKNCAHPMIPKALASAHMLAHWAHTPGHSHHYGTGEMGEWHADIQNLFEHFGATVERPMQAPKGHKHRADVVCPDGRIVEAQTTYLSATHIQSREDTYGDMCWLYGDMRQIDTLVADDRDRSLFRWTGAHPRLLEHKRPVFIDRSVHGIWQMVWLERMTTSDTRTAWSCRLNLVAATQIEFVQAVMAGRPFGDPPKMLDRKATRRAARMQRQGARIGVGEFMLTYYHDRTYGGGESFAARRTTTETSDAQAVAAMAARMTAAGWPGPMRRDGTYPKIGEA